MRTTEEHWRTWRHMFLTFPSWSCMFRKCCFIFFPKGVVPQESLRTVCLAVFVPCHAVSFLCRYEALYNAEPNDALELDTGLAEYVEWLEHEASRSPTCVLVVDVCVCLVHLHCLKPGHSNRVQLKMPPLRGVHTGVLQRPAFIELFCLRLRRKVCAQHFPGQVKISFVGPKHRCVRVCVCVWRKGAPVTEQYYWLKKGIFVVAFCLTMGR